MDRIRKQVALLLAAALIVVLAACSAPDSAGLTFDDGAGTLATNTKLSWSYGSAVLGGSITGLGNTSELTFQGVADGYYLAYCTNGGGDVPGGFIRVSAFGSFESDVTADRRGSVRFGDKKNETGFVIDNPVKSPLNILYTTSDPDIVQENCSNGSGWTYSVDYRVWYITDTFLRYAPTTDLTNWTYLSWVCTTTAAADFMGATLSCTEESPARELSEEDYDPEA
jgi:hypothetical protein